MKKSLCPAFIFLLVFLSASGVSAQNPAQRIYDAERAFEKAAAERGVNQAFIEFSAPESVCFFGGAPENCRVYWKNAPASSAALTWNPTLIDVSETGALAFSTGNSVYRPNGKTDSNAYAGEYATVWERQPDGKYLAVVDIGISHDAPNNETNWTTLPAAANNKKTRAANNSSAYESNKLFMEMAAEKGLGRAYKTYLADDVRLLRPGKLPINGKRAALAEYKNQSLTVSGKSTLVSMADLAYVTKSYTLSGKDGGTIEKGNYLQVWKRRGDWKIVLDVFLPAPPEKNGK